MNISVLELITEEFEKSGFMEFNGQSYYNEGDDCASMYGQYDGQFVTADFTGQVSELFIGSYRDMDAFFRKLLEELPIYRG